MLERVLGLYLCYLLVCDWLPLQIKNGDLESRCSAKNFNINRVSHIVSRIASCEIVNERGLPETYLEQGILSLSNWELIIPVLGLSKLSVFAWVHETDRESLFLRSATALSTVNLHDNLSGAV